MPSIELPSSAPGLASNAEPSRCFRTARRAPRIAPLPPVRLADGHAQALSELIVLLGCGEEAAAIAFAGLAARDADPVAVDALDRVAAEELAHDALLVALASTLPAPRDAPQWLRATRRFHLLAGRGGTVDHLARVAAIDAGVCTVLARITASHRPVGADPVAHAVLARIHCDEGRHVRLSRRLAIDRADGRSLVEVAVAARQGLADVLALGASAFEALSVDPDALLRDVRALPPGLFRA